MGIGGSKFNPNTCIPDLTGKVVIVTGGNRGIGYHTVKHLARHGAKVYLAARNEQAALSAITKLKEELGVGDESKKKDQDQEHGHGQIVWLKLDLSDPRLAKEAAEEFVKMENRLDVLINNAGLISGTGEMTKDGISLMAVTNYISPFAFTRALIPLLTQTANQPGSDVRIINVATAAHKLTRGVSSLHFRSKEDFNPSYKLFNNFFSYCHSKLPLISFTLSLQRRFSHPPHNSPPIPITCISLHPGGVDTYSHTFPLRAITSPLTQLVLYTPDQGSYTTLFAATSPKVVAESPASASESGLPSYKGAYLEPFGKIATPLKEATDEQFGEELWKTTEDVLRDMGI